MRLLLTALAAGLAVAACAEAGPAGNGLAFADAEVRASLGTNPNTGGYVRVENAGARADRLVDAACACADRVELHTMSHEGGVMRMSRVEGFDVPAGGALVLAPGGNHLMLMGLKRPLQAGETVRIALTFQRAGVVERDFAVVAAPKRPAAGHGH